MRSFLAVVSAVALLCFSYGCASEAPDGDTSPAEANAPKTFAAPLPDSAPSAQGTGAPPATASGALQDDGKATDAPARAGDADDDSAETPAVPSAPPPSPGAPAPGAPSAPAPAPSPASNPGPAPASTCSVTKDALGFFSRSSGKSDYVAYVPASYSKAKPMRLIVGLHGCGDNALNFAKWAVNPWDTRATQQHIGISIGGETGGGKCWNIGGDDAKVMAAVEDIAKCFWIDRSKIVLGGYSSGGQLAYRVGLKQADKFAGILVENSGLYAAGDTPQKLVDGAAWNIRIAHTAHVSDSVFPIAKVRADWSTIQSGGLPLTKREVPGTHDGDGSDWATWLIPLSLSWSKP